MKKSIAKYLLPLMPTFAGMTLLLILFSGSGSFDGRLRTASGQSINDDQFYDVVEPNRRQIQDSLRKKLERPIIKPVTDSIDCVEKSNKLKCKKNKKLEEMLKTLEKLEPTRKN